MRKTVYIVNIRTTGCNGGIINATDSAFIFEKAASKRRDELEKYIQDDPNGMVYVTGPIILDEFDTGDSA